VEEEEWKLKKRKKQGTTKKTTFLNFTLKIKFKKIKFSKTT